MTDFESAGQPADRGVRETLTLLPDDFLRAGAILYKISRLDREFIRTLAAKPGVFMSLGDIIDANPDIGKIDPAYITKRWEDISRFAEGRFEHKQEMDDNRKHYYRMLGDIALVDESGDSLTEQ